MTDPVYIPIGDGIEVVAVFLTREENGIATDPAVTERPATLREILLASERLQPGNLRIHPATTLIGR